MHSNHKIVFQASAKDFEKIPGAPVAYWVPQTAIAALTKSDQLGTHADARKGMCTRDNDYFVRYWFETTYHKIGINCLSRDDAIRSKSKWFPYQKGGEHRRWFGNHLSVVNWENDGYELLHMLDLGWTGASTNHCIEYIYKPALVWSKITSSIPCYRYSPEGFLYDDASGMCAVHNTNYTYKYLAFLNSCVGLFYMNIVNPTVNIQPGNIASMPIIQIDTPTPAYRMISIARSDWDSYETSWDFRVNSLLDVAGPSTQLAETYNKLRQQWAEATTEMHRLEEENNHIFIEAYGLQDELTPEVLWNEITLTCNPWYRYGVKPPNPTCDEFPVNEALEARLKADTMKEFLSYAVGCMFGRYSLDKPGLVLANQGETLADYLKQIPQPTFMPDEDNVIPILDEDWFADDIVTRFNEFLKVTYGEESFYENVAFIEEALGKDVRSYFTKDFYKDHLQRYHNRPIYWLFSSPKGAFSALVYMHRYRPETVGLVLTYLRSHITKVTERIQTLETTIDSADSTAGMKNKAIRERNKLQKSLRELEDYERDVLYPLATEKISIDLDDGVKVNYRKFGDALYKIKGLEAKEE